MSSQGLLDSCGIVGVSAARPRELNRRDFVQLPDISCQPGENPLYLRVRRIARVDSAVGYVPHVFPRFIQQDAVALRRPAVNEQVHLVSN